MILVELAILAVVAWLAYTAYVRLTAPSGWRLEERSEGECVRLLATRAGNEPLELARVAVGDEDFDGRLYEARSEARLKVRALNDK